MANKKQPTLHLLEGKQVLNVEALARLYEKLTGKPLTRESVEEVRKLLEKKSKALD